MSSFDRRKLIFALATLPLGACNFRPVYGPGGSGNVIRNRIRVAAPATRIEFEMVARLEDRLGVGSAYDLSYTLTINQRNNATDGAENVVRINIVGALIYSVREAGTGRVVDSGELSTFTAYATTVSPVATASAQRDAEDRLAVILADQLVSQIIASASGWA